MLLNLITPMFIRLDLKFQFFKQSNCWKSSLHCQEALSLSQLNQIKYKRTIKRLFTTIVTGRLIFQVLYNCYQTEHKNIFILILCYKWSEAVHCRIHACAATNVISPLSYFQVEEDFDTASTKLHKRTIHLEVR